MDERLVCWEATWIDGQIYDWLNGKKDSWMKGWLAERKQKGIER